MTQKETHSPDQHQSDAWPQGDVLDRALSASLRPPALPVSFHAALRDAIAREAEQGVLVRRSALEADRALHLEELRAGYFRMRRNTLAMALAAAFTAGAAATVVLPWLAAGFGTDVATLAPILAAAIGLGIGGIVLLQRFGLPRLR